MSDVNRTERRDSEDSDDSGTDSSIEVLSSEEDVQENTVQWNGKRKT